MKIIDLILRLFMRGRSEKVTGLSSEGQSGESGDLSQPKQYMVVAQVLEVPETSEYIIGPRRVIYLGNASQFAPTAQWVRLRFSVVSPGCTRFESDAERPNLLDDNPQVLAEGWYQVSTAFIPNLEIGSSYCGIVLVQSTPHIRTFLPSPRQTIRVIRKLEPSLVSDALLLRRSYSLVR